MRNVRRIILDVDQVESRALLSTFAAPSPAVTADLAKIQTDQRQFATDLKANGSLLRSDAQAIEAAIKASPAVQSAQQSLNSDLKATQLTYQADVKAIVASTTPAAWSAAIAKLKSDVTATEATLKADANRIQTAIANDATVQAAQAKLKADGAILQTDEAAIQADYVQLAKDLRAQVGSTTSTPAAKAGPK